MTELLLEARAAQKYFPVQKGLLFAKTVGHIKAVDGVSFSIEEGKTFGLVGESGCGKTTMAKCILLLEKLTSGQVFVGGRDISKLNGEQLKQYRGMVQAVFQDPYSSLSPRMRVRDIVAEPVVVNRRLSRKELKERVTEVMGVVGLHEEMGNRYPHEFSGGQRQRVAVARALSLSPKLMVLDEPISALDVSIRAQIMNLLRQLQAQYSLSYLLIAHDLAVVRHMSDQVGVMYLGKIVEYADSNELYAKTLHPYTKALVSAAMPSEPGVRRDEIVLSGEVPSPLNPPPGCRFHPRCPFAMPKCSEGEPALVEAFPGHKVACFLHSDKVAQPEATTVSSNGKKPS
ncbi:MAG: ATP-binding cassette domain-containing protein [Chloroflexi bacterium]|nr:ATP-binding cassette domain-containing protein [Chloroflexota bacterium]